MPVHIRTVLFFWIAATTVSIIRPVFIENILLNLLIAWQLVSKTKYE